MWTRHCADSQTSGDMSLMHVYMCVCVCVCVCVQVWWWGKHGSRSHGSRWRSCLDWKITGANVSPGAPQEPPRAARCTSASHVSINTHTHTHTHTHCFNEKSLCSVCSDCRRFLCLTDTLASCLLTHTHTHTRTVRKSVSWLKVMEHLCRSESADRRQSGAHKHTHKLTHRGLSGHRFMVVLILLISCSSSWVCVSWEQVIGAAQGHFTLPLSSRVECVCVCVCVIDTETRRVKLTGSTTQETSSHLDAFRIRAK